MAPVEYEYLIELSDGRVVLTSGWEVVSQVVCDFLGTNGWWLKHNPRYPGASRTCSRDNKKVTAWEWSEVIKYPL